MSIEQQEPAEEYRPEQTPAPVEPAAVEPEVTTAPVATEEPVEEHPEPMMPPKVFVRPESIQNVKVSEAVSAPLNGPLDTTQEVIDLPSDFPNHVWETLDNAPNTKVDQGEKGQAWFNSLQEGLRVVPLEGAYRKTLEDTSAEWNNVPQGPTGPLKAATPLYNYNSDELTGEAGLLHLMRHVGLGTVFRAPMWNTGIWITLKSPGEDRILEFHREIISDQIELGRSSYGMALSSTSVYTAERLVNFALEMLYASSLKTDLDLKQVLSAQDLWTLVWALACTIWNNGVQYTRPCTFDPTTCIHVVEEKLNVNKLLWVNQKALTQTQLMHMSKRNSNEMTLEQVNRYKEEMLCAHDRTINIDFEKGGKKTTLRFVLRVPTIAEYITAGTEWITSLSSMVNAMLGLDTNIGERNAHIVAQGRATTMRQRAHWVKSIQFDEGDRTFSMSTPKSIYEALNRLSENDKVRDQFETKVREFIDSSTVSVIGIPRYNCPKCGQPHQKEIEHAASGTSIIPLDVYETFFKLVVQKVARISSR